MLSLVIWCVHNIRLLTNRSNHPNRHQKGWRKVISRPSFRVVLTFLRAASFAAASARCAPFLFQFHIASCDLTSVLSFPIHPCHTVSFQFNQVHVNQTASVPCTAFHHTAKNTKQVQKGLEEGHLVTPCRQRPDLPPRRLLRRRFQLTCRCECVLPCVSP